MRPSVHPFTAFEEMRGKMIARWEVNRYIWGNSDRLRVCAVSEKNDIIEATDRNLT